MPVNKETDVGHPTGLYCRARAVENPPDDREEESRKTRTLGGYFSFKDLFRPMPNIMSCVLAQNILFYHRPALTNIGHSTQPIRILLLIVG